MELASTNFAGTQQSAKLYKNLPYFYIAYACRALLPSVLLIEIFLTPKFDCKLHKCLFLLKKNDKGKASLVCVPTFVRVARQKHCVHRPQKTLREAGEKIPFTLTFEESSIELACLILRFLCSFLYRSRVRRTFFIRRHVISGSQTRRPHPSKANTLDFLRVGQAAGNTARPRGVASKRFFFSLTDKLFYIFLPSLTQVLHRYLFLSESRNELNVGFNLCYSHLTDFHLRIPGHHPLRACLYLIGKLDLVIVKFRFLSLESKQSNLGWVFF